MSTTPSSSDMPAVTEQHTHMSVHAANLGRWVHVQQLAAASSAACVLLSPPPAPAQLLAVGMEVRHTKTL